MSKENPTETPVTPPFEDLVREHQAGLRAFVRALGADEAFVDDLAQEAFIVAYRRLGDFEAGTNFGRWLRGIARHLVVAHCMAAIFHDDDGLVVAQHMRQRLHEDFSLLQGAVLAGVGHVAAPKLEGLRRS